MNTTLYKGILFILVVPGVIALGETSVDFVQRWNGLSAEGFSHLYLALMTLLTFIHVPAALCIRSCFAGMLLWATADPRQEGRVSTPVGALLALLGVAISRLLPGALVFVWFAGIEWLGSII